MHMDAIFPPVESSGQKSGEFENISGGRGMHVSQVHSTSKNVGNPEREISLNSLQGISKQQQYSSRPQTPSFPVSGGGSSSNFHSHPYARPPISVATTSVRPQQHDSHMRPSQHSQGMASTQPGTAQPGNVINAPKYELQNIGNDGKRLQGGPFTSHSTSQQLPVSWHTMANKEQRNASVPSMPYVKQEVVDQVSEPASKSQLTPPDVPSFGSGHVGQRNPTMESMNIEGIEKQSSRMGFSSSLNTMGSQTTLVDSALQVSILILFLNVLIE